MQVSPKLPTPPLNLIHTNLGVSDLLIPAINPKILKADVAKLLQPTLFHVCIEL